MACCCFVLESSICASVSFASLNLILQSSGGLVNVNSGANSVKYCDARTKVALIMSNLCRSRTIRRHSAKYDKPRTKSTLERDTPALFYISCLPSSIFQGSDCKPGFRRCLPQKTFPLKIFGYRAIYKKFCFSPISVSACKKKVLGSCTHNFDATDLPNS